MRYRRSSGFWESHRQRAGTPFGRPLRVSYRQTRRFKTSDQAVSAWVRQTELEAAELDIAEFDAARLREAIPDLRHNTRLAINDALSKAQQIGSQCGVAVVLVPALPQTGLVAAPGGLETSGSLSGSLFATK